MALLATNRFAGDGATTSYEFNFVGKYIARTHVKVYQEDNATKVRTPVAITDSNFLNDTTLRNLPVTPSGKTLVIYRETPKPPMVDFTNGARFTEYNMDLVARQGLFVAMEAMDEGGPAAMQQLRDALAVAGSLVNAANAVVSDATAAALTAAASAAAAQDAVTLATAAQTAAESANTAAQGAKASLDGMQADVTWTRDRLVETRESLADTKADVRDLHATITETRTSLSDTKADVLDIYSGLSDVYSGLAAANAEITDLRNNPVTPDLSGYATTQSVQGRMCCRVLVTNVANRTLTLQRCGGQTMSINGVSRVIPAGGISINVVSSSTPSYLYAGWNGTSITLTENGAQPTFDNTLGQWIYPGNANSTPVAFFRGDGLATPERFLRNYYKGPGIAAGTQSLSSDYTANWDGLERQLITMPFLILPGDSIELQAQASIMSTLPGRVGDLLIRLNGGSNLARARNTHTGETYMWHNYSCLAGVIQRGHGPADPASQIIAELYYSPISTIGNTFTVLGDSISTRLVVSITPYKFA